MKKPKPTTVKKATTKKTTTKRQTRKPAAPKVTPKVTPKTADPPLFSGRDSEGRFTCGNAYRWQSGASGNPLGRSMSITDAIRAQIGATFNSEGQDLTIGQAIAEQLIRQALGGSLMAIREVLDRLEGKPRQSMDLSLNEQDTKRQECQRALDFLRDHRSGDGQRLPEALILEGLLQIHPEAREVLPEVFE